MASLSHKFDLATALARLPDQPGVYRMFSERDELLYVGKAKNLKNRVRTYFQSPRLQAPKVQALMQHVVRFDYIVTDTELEALMLEYNLIKQFRPKYNILLRDDKRFPWIGLSTDAFPRLFVTRNPSFDPKARYFGPYANSGSMHQTLHLLKKLFPMRQRRKPLFKNRPCMNYYIGTCPGPCQNLVSADDYARTVRQVELFLKGKADDLLEMLQRDMQAASEALDFESAARLRDRYLAVQNVVEQQKMFYADERVSQDIVASACDTRRCVVTVLNIRRGKLIAIRAHEIPLAHQATPEEAYGAFVVQHYLDADPDDLPDELVLEHPVEDAAVLEDWFAANRRRKITLTWPQKGVKKELLALAMRNAREALEHAHEYDARQHKSDPVRALSALQEALGLPRFPSRMECYDISHVQGAHTVASMVVFTDGVPDKKAYRRFKIQSAEGKPDDFKSMAEVILRRFARAKGLGDGWEAPDLVIIDGGKGQLQAAVSVLDTLDLSDQPIISLAKKFEEVYRPGESRPVLLSRDSAALFLLQQIRDEAHRFAITYHRTLRGKAATASALDDIAGLGPRRKQKLIAHFGSLAVLRQATPEALRAAPGITAPVAEAVYQAFHGPES